MGKNYDKSLEIDDLNREDLKGADIDGEDLEINILREEGLRQRKS